MTETCTEYSVMEGGLGARFTRAAGRRIRMRGMNCRCSEGPTTRCEAWGCSEAAASCCVVSGCSGRAVTTDMSSWLMSASPEPTRDRTSDQREAGLT
jgi:hypothetical protein